MRPTASSAIKFTMNALKNETSRDEKANQAAIKAAIKEIDETNSSVPLLN